MNRDLDALLADLPAPTPPAGLEALVFRRADAISRHRREGLRLQAATVVLALACGLAVGGVTAGATPRKTELAVFTADAALGASALLGAG